MRDQLEENLRKTLVGSSWELFECTHTVYDVDSPLVYLEREDSIGSLAKICLPLVLLYENGYRLHD